MSAPEVKSEHTLNGHDGHHEDLEQHTLDPSHSKAPSNVTAANPESSTQNPSATPASSSSSSSSASSDGDSIELRYLIDSAQVGAIIGKNGATVKHIRESSHVYLSIHQKEGRAVERIMSVKGSAGEQSKAAELIAQALIDAFKERRDSLQSNGSQANANRAQRKQQEAFLAHGTNETSTVLKILVHKSHVGAVIGKAGSTIKDIQSQTGAKIQVSNEPLPLSTDKTMSFSGTPAAIGAAIFSALSEMKKNPMKAGVKSTPYNPATSHSGFQDHPLGFNVNAMQPYMSPLLATSAAYGHSLPAASASLAQQSQKIAIPTVCAGLVIGKRGNTIKSLRSQSGCFIQIADPEEQTPNERVVTITGTVQGINQAILLIRQLVERYVPPNANGNAH